MQRFYLLWIFLLSAPAVSAQKQVAELLRNGDIIFQETNSAQSKAI